MATVTNTSKKPDPPKDDKPKPTAEDYGYVKAFLKKHPDVAAIVRKAVAKGYTPQRFAAEVKGTKWWTSRNDMQREWDLLSAENPAEATRRTTAKTNDLVAQGRAMGISLSRDEAIKYAKHALAFGYTDTELAAVLAHEYALPGAGKAGTGTAGEIDSHLQATASAYGIRLDSGTRRRYTESILAGQADQNAYDDALREQAKIAFPSIAKHLDAGMTTQDFLSPYMQAAASELGVPASSMLASDSKWNKVLSGGGGKPDVPMNMDEWTRTIRTQTEYGWNKTEAAKKIAADFVAQMGQTMGARG